MKMLQMKNIAKRLISDFLIGEKTARETSSKLKNASTLNGVKKSLLSSISSDGVSSM